MATALKFAEAIEHAEAVVAELPEEFLQALCVSLECERRHIETALAEAFGSYRFTNDIAQVLKVWM